MEARNTVHYEKFKTKEAKGQKYKQDSAVQTEINHWICKSHLEWSALSLALGTQ